MNDFKKNLKKDQVPNLHVKKRPGPKLKNRRNYAYSACCDYNCAFDIGRNINNDVNWR